MLSRSMFPTEREKDGTRNLQKKEREREMRRRSDRTVNLFHFSAVCAELYILENTQNNVVHFLQR